MQKEHSYIVNYEYPEYILLKERNEWKGCLHLISLKSSLKLCPFEENFEVLLCLGDIDNSI